MTKKMVLEFINGLMAQNMKDILKMISNKVREQSDIKMGKLLNFYGKMGSH